MTPKHKNLSPKETDRIIGLAWQDRCSFEQIEAISGLREPDVIRLMRAQLKPGSFRRWRRRVSGRVTKHRKRFKRSVCRCSAEDHRLVFWTEPLFKAMEPYRK